MAGAHLDSVPAGPGINDNGSGSAALLELAQQLAKLKPENTLRFAWWGGEEEGLIGSTAYVDDLSAAESDRIALYMNFDMIGSPNYIFMVYDADQSSFEAPVPIPPGSTAIEDVFESFYTLVGEPYDDTEFSGRSDYQAFIENGIPSGGLFTGAEEMKTEEQEAIWGGTAGRAVRPLLPPGLRHVREHQRARARREQRRDRVRHAARSPTRPSRSTACPAGRFRARRGWPRLPGRKGRSSRSPCERSMAVVSSDSHRPFVNLPQPDYEADDILVVSETEQLRALADDVRRRIVAILRERASTTTELAEEVGLAKGHGRAPPEGARGGRARPRRPHAPRARADGELLRPRGAALRDQEHRREARRPASGSPRRMRSRFSAGIERARCATSRGSESPQGEEYELVATLYPSGELA